MANLRTEILGDWTAVQALEREWDPLLRASHADSIFLTWEWIRCWAATVGHPPPRVVSVREAGGALVGLAPLYEASFRLGRLLPVRALRVMGDHPTSAEYGDWILRPDAAEAAIPAIVAALAARPGWDLLWMPWLRGWTGSWDRILASSRALGLACRERPAEFAFLPLPETSDAFFRSLSSNKRRQLRTEQRRMEKQTGVEICRCETQEQLGEFLDALFELHARRWGERGERGSFVTDPRKAAFYRRFASVALERGWLWLYGLRDAGAFKAMQLGYVYGGAFHQIQEGFDPSYWQGAGNVLRQRIIEHCIASDVRVYDFLGGMSEHKRRWASQARGGHDLLIGRNTLRSRLVLASGFWPGGRALPEVPHRARPAPEPGLAPAPAPATRVGRGAT